jgi:hypothetical protein
MADRWGHATDGYSFRFFSPEQVDQILRDGFKRGRGGSHAAIERILKHEPGIERAELWQRIRDLKFPATAVPRGKLVWAAEDEEILSRGYQKGWSGKRSAVRELLRRHPGWRPHLIWKRAAKLGLVRENRKCRRERSGLRWSEHENHILLSLAGYKAAGKIAGILHRSEASVRYRLALLGKSSRVHLEGFSRRELAAELHLGRKTIQRLIVEGLLEVRDPRITRQSLQKLRASGRFILSSRDVEAREPELPHRRRNGPASSSQSPPTESSCSRAERVWSETGQSLGIPAATVKNLIAHGALKLHDATITEKSLRRFCHGYGSLINYEFLNRETRAWLEGSMDFVRNSGESASRRLVPLRKHAHVIRQCAQCRHAIRGNVFFRHIKNCGTKRSKNNVQQAAKHDLP